MTEWITDEYYLVHKTAKAVQIAEDEDEGKTWWLPLDAIQEKEDIEDARPGTTVQITISWQLAYEKGMV